MPGHLIMSAFLVAGGLDVGQMMALVPLCAIGGSHPVELPDAGVFGISHQKTLLRVVHRLGIGHFQLQDLGERVDVVGIVAAVDETGALLGAAAHEHPEVSVLIYLQGRVVVGVVNLLLVVDADWHLHHSGLVVEATYHAEKMPFVRCGGAAIHEEGLVHLGSINRHGIVLHGVGAEASGIFVAVGGFLPQSEPDALVARLLAVVQRLCRGGDGQNQSQYNNANPIHSFRGFRPAIR